MVIAIDVVGAVLIAMSGFVTSFLSSSICGYVYVHDFYVGFSCVYLELYSWRLVGNK